MGRVSLFGIRPVFASAGFAGADGPQEIEAENSRSVAVVEINLQGVVAYGVSGLRGQFRLVQGQQRGTRRCRGLEFRALFLLPLVVAHRAGALFAQIGEIVVAGVVVRPGYVHPGSRRNAQRPATVVAGV